MRQGSAGSLNVSPPFSPHACRIPVRQGSAGSLNVSPHFPPLACRIPVRQGSDGLKEFTDKIRALFHLPDDVDVACMSFGCREPMSGVHLQLDRIGAFDAWVHCAAIAAAERQLQMQSDSGGGDGSGGGSSDSSGGGGSNSIGGGPDKGEADDCGGGGSCPDEKRTVAAVVAPARVRERPMITSAAAAPVVPARIRRSWLGCLGPCSSVQHGLVWLKSWLNSRRHRSDV